LSEAAGAQLATLCLAVLLLLLLVSWKAGR
jgi:hypothetical protein